jgi:type III secretion system FlhB-like substrate exporter
MNERIIELAYKVVSEADIDMNIPPEFYEKFAELIVLECAAMTRNLSAHGELAEKAVKEHFGIEE